MNEWLLILVLLLLTLGFAFILVYPFRRKKSHVGLSLILILPMILMAYLHWGAFYAWQDYQTNQLKTQEAKRILKEQGGIGQIIAKLRVNVEANPERAQGWYLLGKLYAGRGQWPQALKALEKAYQLEPDNLQYQIYYAQMRWQNNNQIMDEELRNFYLNILEKHPKQADVLAMLAMDAYMSHHYEQAINYWQTLLKAVPERSKEADLIRKTIAKAQSKMQIKS